MRYNAFKACNNEKTNGKLITLFGIDGSGKSTIASMLQSYDKENILSSPCFKNAVFRDELRAVQKRYSIKRIENFTTGFILLLYYGSIVQTMYNRVIPLLKNGSNVVLDRYTLCLKVTTELFADSSFHNNTKVLDCLPSPDLGIYFDVDIENAVYRISERNRLAGEVPDEYESYENLRLKKERYEELIPNEKYKIVRVDANQSVTAVLFDVITEINKEILRV